MVPVRIAAERLPLGLGEPSLAVMVRPQRRVALRPHASTADPWRALSRHAGLPTEAIVDERTLREENAVYAGSGGRSEESRGLGFCPAFYDFATQTIHPSRFGDGRLAPIHVLDGLPNELVVDRSDSGRVVRVKPSVIAGFVRNGFFYTRAAAARAIAEWGARPLAA